MTELEELRAVVLAQSKLLTTLVQYLHEDEPVEKPVVLSQDEVGELMETICAGLPPKLVRTYFPLADDWMKAD